jgi:hypothetical protein
MNKTVIITSAIVFGIGGGYIPFLWDDTDLFSAWSIVFGMIGGIFGIWIGSLLSRRIG